MLFDISHWGQKAAGIRPSLAKDNEYVFGMCPCTFSVQLIFNLLDGFFALGPTHKAHFKDKHGLGMIIGNTFVILVYMYIYKFVGMCIRLYFRIYKICIKTFVY